MIPTSGSPASSRSSSASGIDVTSVSAVALGGVDRLEPEPDARLVGRRGDPLQAVDRRGAGPPHRSRSPAARSGRGRSPARRGRSGAADAQSDVDRVFSTSSGPSITVFGRIEGTERHAVRDAQAAGAYGLEVGLVVRTELHLPDPDPVEAGGRIRAEVVAEACATESRSHSARASGAAPGSFASRRLRSGGRVRCLATM